MATGTVRWFNGGKGYGFIAPNDGGDDLYAHYSAIETQGYKFLEEGQKVEFTIQVGPKGPQAANIRALGDACAVVASGATQEASEAMPGATGRQSLQPVSPLHTST